MGGGPAPVEAAPAGFTDTVVDNLSRLTAIEALPDGRVVVLEQSGALIRLDDRDGSVERSTLGQFSVCSNSERGLLGFTTDPTFVTSGTVYIYRTVASSEPGGCHNRVSSFTMNESGINPGSERILVDRISSVAGNHNGGDIEIGNDGYLYIAVGDAGGDPRGDSGSAGANDAGQDMSLLNGKILRVDRTTGFAAPGNPFTGPDTADCRVRGNTPATPTTTCREIFASGLRNPYRFAFDPNTSDTRFYINDVGQGDREEVNEGQAGANYGWPMREGACPQGQNPPCPGPADGLVDPVTDYGHGAGLFITGGAFVPNGVWPSEYDDTYLVTDGAFGTMWAHRGEPILSDAEEFLTASAPTDMAFVTGPTGVALWYVQQNGDVHKVTADTPAAAADSGPLRYEALPTIDRRFDSRALTPRAPLRGGQTRLIDIDAPSGARAAFVNITLIRPQASGAFVTAWQPRTLRPATATSNGDAGAITANASIVPVDDDGNVVVFAQASSDMVIDVAGFFFDADSAVAAGRFVTTAQPSRLADTRQPLSAENPFTVAAEADGDAVTVPVAGRGGLPDDVGVIDAAVLVVTAIGTDGGSGFVTVTASGADRPVASNVNVNDTDDVRANLVVAPLGADGSIEVYLEGVRHVAVDVAGYLTGADADSETAGRFHLVPPTREVDTRSDLGFSTLTPSSSGSVEFTSVPDSASGFVQNLTMIRTAGRGFVSVLPIPLVADVSSVNASGAGQVRGALNMVSTGDFGVVYTSSIPTELTVDVFGWFE